MEGKNREGILVADDAEFSRGILKILLRFDYDVLEAADGREAIARLEADAAHIACVLLDIRMPGVDGYGVLDFMRGAGLADRIPVVALTSISDPRGHIRCYESGAFDIIEKPFDEDLLLYKLRWDIDRFRRLAPAASATAANPARQDPALSASLRAIAAHCRGVYGIGTEEEARKMATSFLRTFGDCAERLRALADAPDFAAVCDVTHDLRGFAANSGAEDLDDIAVVLNACAKAENAEATSSAIRRLLALYDEYRA